MSLYNTLLLGSPTDVADALDACGSTVNTTELRLSLINALRRIDYLEEKIAQMLDKSGEK